MGVLEAIRYTNHGAPKLEILDQLQLPHTSHYDAILSAEDGWQAIRHMRTRGAPAIAIVAALSLAVELGAKKIDGAAVEARDLVHERLTYLVTSRPTAVNLEDAARKLGRVVDEAAGREGADAGAVVEAYVRAAEEMLRKDVQDNEAIGRHGAEWIAKNAGHATPRKVNVITHCNTGSLATAGYGTALGVIRSLNGGGLLEHAYCTETRPYNQGSRLTAYELMHDKIPSTLVTDSMAAALMNSKRTACGAIDAVVVGADRVVANGDTANKIGTYSLAVLAKHHGAKFVVAAPLTSIDLGKKSGEEITIEYRPDRELTLVKGPLFEGAVVAGTSKAVSMAPEGVQVWNPAFDVTPASLIDAIVTEVGVIERDAATGVFDMKSLFK